MKPWSKYLLAVIPVSFLAALIWVWWTGKDFWQPTNGPGSVVVNAIAFNHSTGKVFAGTFAGVFSSSNQGDTWISSSSGMTYFKIHALAINANGQLFSGNEEGVGRSDSEGNNWYQIFALGQPVYSLAIDSSGNIFAGTESANMFRSKDNGATWDQLSLIPNVWTTNIVTLAVDSAGHIYAGAKGYGVFRSTTAGDSWEQINTNLPNLAVNSLAVKSDGTVFAGTEGGVFRYDGTQWQPTDTVGMKYNLVFSLAINPSGRIYAGTANGGVYLSLDNGKEWRQINKGLTNTATSVHSLAIDKIGLIFAGVESGKVYRSTRKS